MKKQCKVVFQFVLIFSLIISSTMTGIHAAPKEDPSYTPQDPLEYTAYVKNNYTINGGTVTVYGNAVVDGTVSGLGWDKRVEQGLLYYDEKAPEYLNGSVWYKDFIDGKGYLSHEPFLGERPDIDLDLKAFPTLTQKGALTVNGTVNISESGWYSKLSITTDGRTNFSVTADEGEVIEIRVDEFLLNNAVTINGNGKVIFYVDKFVSGGVPRINLNGNPDQVMIYVSGKQQATFTNIWGSFNIYAAGGVLDLISSNINMRGNIYTEGSLNLDNTCNITGFVCAPKSTVTMAGNAKVYGKLIANNLATSGSAQIIMGDVTSLTDGIVDYITNSQAPTVLKVASTSPNGSYTVGAVIPITVQFSKIVNVTGVPRLMLETGATDRYALYASGSGTNTLTFNYTVQQGDYTTDLNYVGIYSLDLNVNNTATIKDTSNKNAILTLPALNNANSLAGGSNISIDTAIPNVSITSTAANPTKLSPIPVTITFSEAVTGFVASDITVVNGTVGSLSGSGTTYTVNITPIAQGDVTVSVGGSKAFDAAGNGNSASAQLVRTYDSIAPTVTLSSTATNNTNVSPIPVTITFSEAVTGFALNDITIVNGTAGSFSGSGTTYTINITPNAQGTVTVNVGASKVTDAAGNGNTAAVQLVRTYDTIAPAVPALTATPTSATNGNVTVAISYPADAVVKLYRIGSSGAWTAYSAALTISQNTTVYAKCQDAAGNWSAEGSVVVNNINGVPTANAVNITATEDTVYNGILTGSDVEGNNLTFIKVTDPAHGTVAINTNGSFTYTPAANYYGSDSFTFKVNDGVFDSAAVTAAITVTAVNDAPVMTAINTLTGTLTNTPFTITYADLAGAANESDVEGNSIRFVINAVSTGTLTKAGVAVVPGTTLASGESLVWTPAENASGVLNAFTVKASDGILETAPVQVKVDVREGSITVTVKNPDGTGLSDVLVSITRDGVKLPGGVTNDSGICLFEDMQTGVYNITIQKPSGVTVVGDESRTVSLTYSSISTSVDFSFSNPASIFDTGEDFFKLEPGYEDINETQVVKVTENGRVDLKIVLNVYRPFNSMHLLLDHEFKNASQGGLTPSFALSKINKINKLDETDKQNVKKILETLNQGDKATINNVAGSIQMQQQTAYNGGYYPAGKYEIEFSLFVGHSIKDESIVAGDKKTVLVTGVNIDGTDIVISSPLEIEIELAKLPKVK